MKRQLILEDGTVFIGEGFGSDASVTGEIVFNTGMTGYEEVITDPSYCGQIVTMTYPLIGNYGVNRDSFQAINPAFAAFVVKEVAEFPSNWRSEMSLDEFMKVKNIPGIAGVDTRKLTKLIRENGTLKAIICDAEEDESDVLERLRATNLRKDQVKQVSTKNAFSSPGHGDRVVIVDFGMKHSILRELNERNCDVIVVPYHTTAEEILALSPDGMILSNGPGNPEDVPEAVEMIKGVIGKVPLFGIGLGHQLFALACGATSIKMKFGHRGANHPVKDLTTGKVTLTTQNHGYNIDAESISETELEITHIALNDGTIEGLRHVTANAFSVQYDPEAAPGLDESGGLFDEFLNLVESAKREDTTYAKA